MYSRNRIRLIAIRLIISVLCFSFFTAACTSDGGKSNKDLNETEIADIVGQTLEAEEQLTAQAIEEETKSSLSAPVTEAFAVQQTIDSQQATLNAQATLINQPNPTSTEDQETAVPPAETSIPTNSASLDPIALVDWKPINMVEAPGCGEDRNGPQCWSGSKAEMSITSLKPIYIDPSWPSPHLVFSHRYVFLHPATIYVNVKGGWEILWSFPDGQSAPWIPFQVDISKFKGEEILLQMYATGSLTTQSGKLRVSSWDIRDPQIIPDYSPY